MKRQTHFVIGAILILAAGGLVPAQESAPERAVVPLSNPGKPALVEVETMRGAITIKGYDGKDVIVEARTREKVIAQAREGVAPALAPTPQEIPAPPAPAARAERAPKEKNAKAAGMKLIPLSSSGLSIEEENNVVSINTESWKRAVDLVIQVPAACSLKLTSQNDGEIKVDNVSGEIEVENLNGSITLTNCSGTVVASTLNGEVSVGFVKVAPDKPMSFSTMNGDIDVTFPADLKATVRLKSERGDVYSDFDMTLKQDAAKTEEPRREDGKYRISFDRSILGAINGGGPEIQFSTFNGDIYIRKKK
jgi:DUF4097 and DUF4098 domain-containing protein YvlB